MLTADLTLPAPPGAQRRAHGAWIFDSQAALDASGWLDTGPDTPPETTHFLRWLPPGVVDNTEFPEGHWILTAHDDECGDASCARPADADPRELLADLQAAYATPMTLLAAVPTALGPPHGLPDFGWWACPQYALRIAESVIDLFDRRLIDWRRLAHLLRGGAHVPPPRQPWMVDPRELLSLYRQAPARACAALQRVIHQPDPLDDTEFHRRLALWADPGHQHTLRTVLATATPDSADDEPSDTDEVMVGPCDGCGQPLWTVAAPTGQRSTALPVWPAPARNPPTQPAAVAPRPVLTAAEMLHALAGAAREHPIRVDDAAVACDITITEDGPHLQTRPSTPGDANPGGTHLDPEQLRALLHRWITGWTGQPTRRYLRCAELDDITETLLTRTEQRRRLHTLVHAGLRRLTAGRGPDLPATIRDALRTHHG